MARLADGRISSRTVDGQTVSYTYDEAGQLTSETRGGVATAYSYDGNFNRLTKSVGGSVVETYAYSDDDRLLSVTSSAGVRSFDYDNAGRTTAERWQGAVVKTYAWNADDRLTTATGAFGTRSYGYSFSGARASETGGQGRSWLRRGTGVTSPVLRDGALRHTPGVGFRPQSGGAFRTAHGDAKLVSALTDASGAVTSTQERDAFGMAVSSSGDWSTPFQYGGRQGYQTDDTGLQLLGHRYYDPSTGRFLTRDPIKDGPNWYAYCLNDPVNRADASGLEWHDPVQVVVSDEFRGKVWVVGESGPGEEQTFVEVGRGGVSPAGMDVDIVIVQHEDGRQERYFLPGANPPQDWVQVGSTYEIGKDGSVNPGPSVYREIVNGRWPGAPYNSSFGVELPVLPPIQFGKGDNPFPWGGSVPPGLGSSTGNLNKDIEAAKGRPRRK